MSKLKGIVIEGKKLGRKLGFPTANIKLNHKLESGVYAGLVQLGGKNHNSAIFVWPDKLLLEAHILDFEGDIYGQEIIVKIDTKIRDVVKFSSQAELIKQIQKDLEVIRKL